MGEVVDIEQWKRDRLAKLEDMFAQYMDRAAALQQQGKHSFAKEMVKKAAKLRPSIDRLRKVLPKPKPKETTPFLNGNQSPMLFTFGRFDMGYPKTPEVTPEPRKD